MYEEEKDLKRKIVALFPLYNTTPFLLRIFHHSISCDVSQKTYGPDWKAIIIHAASACIASVLFNRRPARREIHPASLFEARSHTKLESMPQGIVATWSEPVT